MHFVVIGIREDNPKLGKILVMDISDKDVAKLDYDDEVYGMYELPILVPHLRLRIFMEMMDVYIEEDELNAWRNSIGEGDSPAEMKEI